MKYAIDTPTRTANTAILETTIGFKNSSKCCSPAGLTIGFNQLTNESPRENKYPDAIEPIDNKEIGINIKAGLSCGSSLCPQRSFPKKVMITTRDI
ncbi:unannotated protein [freshwater metagenome]|uniref:Unannotated protein n=1 Tax=freshwater metagenome TaxID=449393 RepID=A0A6J6HWK9_9ZZZZ